MIITEDACCKLLIGSTNEEERKVGYIVKIKQVCDDDGHETYWCLTKKELKALINYLVKEL